MRMTSSNAREFDSWWKTTLLLLHNYFELVVVKYVADPVKQDDLWDAFCDYFRSLHMTGPVYLKFRDGTDMDRADILDTFLLERTSGTTFPTS